MRKLFIILIIINGLSGFAIGQEFIRMNFTQPKSLAVSAGHDTICCTGHPVVLGGLPTATGGSHNYIYLWSPPEGLNDPTSSNPIATIGESRTYMVSVTDGNGCEAVSFVRVDIDLCLGIDYKNLNPSITLFPNPSNGVFSIRGIDSYPGRLQGIEVINQLGQIVFNRSFDPGEPGTDILVDTGIREPGVYYLKVSLTDRIVTQRLIVR